ncbi:MAG: BON domain-containing protein, partial [Rhodobacteraceae bacterium]|nr:BON domain-containing protein [Paracoccaceae bacterium]
MRQSEIIALVSVVCLGVGALGFGRYVASSVEDGLAERSREKLAVIGYSDVIVDVDGMVVALSGRVQTEKDREILIATLESTAKSTFGVGSVVDNLVVVSPLVEFAPTKLFIQKDDEVVTISGEAPNAAARDLLAARVEMSRSGSSFINLMKTQDTRASDSWLAAAEAAIDAVTALRVGQATVERSVVRVEGAAKDASSRDRIAARLQQRIDPTFALIMDISAPPPILSPYVFAARKSETRGLEILR